MDEGWKDMEGGQGMIYRVDMGLIIYFLGAFLGVTICLIWFCGMIITDHEMRLRYVEVKQYGLQETQAHTLARMENATRDMVMEVREMTGGKK